ncbi:MAG: error-prone polymerase DnaE [Pseudomonadota bacterium]|jgi:error-prone DNA polymerase
MAQIVGICMACMPEVTAPEVTPVAPAYAELFCMSNFSFQRGASHPAELVERAHALGYAALALTDECSVAGVVRAHAEARRLGLKFLPGAHFVLPDVTFVVLPHSLSGWGQLCQLITTARRKADKGRYQLPWTDPAWDALADCELLLVPERRLSFESLCAWCLRARDRFAERLWMGVVLQHGPDDALWLYTLQRASQLTGLPLVAAGQVLMHLRSRKPLQDVINAVRLHQPVAQCGAALQANAEAHLRSRQRLAQLYPQVLLANTLQVAERCHFSLDELRYQYPQETLLPGLTPDQTLRQYTQEGVLVRYPDGAPPAVLRQIEHELALIAQLKYEMYFLTVFDIVRFARSQGILCQGRGSAANSAVCYCLGVTEVDPARTHVLFERFISRERNEPPDIDVDFEHDRREEVIQYIYQKYGRDRAALTAVVTSYRTRSALRDVGKALGVDEVLIEQASKAHSRFNPVGSDSDAWAQALGVAALDDRQAQWLSLTRQLIGFPRHLSQHPGGFVLTDGPLSRLVPIENAAMFDRSIIQWDKDDLDEVGLLKVDVLALGMLSAIRRCLALVGQRRGQELRMQDIPDGDAPTYDMICAADTVGVFQIESRAQMSMLPRLRPRNYYGLVVEVAIVRPGPIQGGMVHPYLRRRQGLDPVDVPPALEAALKRTLGVPIFQEQVMQIAMLAANFSGDEADQLRRSMAAWKRKGGVHKFHDLLISRMVANGYTADFAENIFSQIEGFGEYGFPESHAASFALLVYVSAWLKCHEPACFLVALLNSQPMGFYSPSQLVQDARRHGVEVRSVDVSHSDWDSTLDKLGSDPHCFSGDGMAPAPAVRLGLHLVSGLAAAAAQRIVAARTVAPFEHVDDLALRAQLDRGDLNALSASDALASLAGHRRQQAWAASALVMAPALLRHAPVQEAPLLLPQASEGQEVLHDYAALGLSLRRHPVAILRPQLAHLKLKTSAQLQQVLHGRRVSACGLVSMRQAPPTAKGVVFVTLEDEHGCVNVIVWPSVREQQVKTLLQARLLAVWGEWQRDVDSGGQVRHLIARRLQDLTPLLGGLSTQSREFH